VIRLMFDPDGIRPFVENWEAAADALVQRVHREAVGGLPDPATAALLQEALAYPGVPAQWRSPDFARTPLPVVPVEFRKGGRALSYFSTVTTLGTPQDAMLQEIRVESFFPPTRPPRRTTGKRSWTAGGSARLSAAGRASDGP